MMETYTNKRGFCQVEKNPKIREKLGSGWVGQVLTRIWCFFWKFCVFVLFFVVVHVSKKYLKLDVGVSEWGLDFF